MVKSTLTTASVLAFERKLDISDGFFWQENSQDKNATQSMISVQEKSVRGTISNRLKNTISNDPVKLDAEIQKANLQRVDSSSLDEDKDTLVVRFTCKVLPFTGTPNVCNNQDYQKAIQAVVQTYQQTHGFDELAKRYALNIINGRFLWRNRLGAEKIDITVKVDDEILTFADVQDIKLNSFDYQSDELTKLTNYIKQGFNGERLVILSVQAKAVVGYGQEVYPSQELILDTGSKKSKVLYRVGDVSKNHAGLHSQKISNAIRTIDTWYPDALFPIAIEPYGAVTTLGTAFRQPKQKQDFYTLLDNWVLKGEVPNVEQQHYVMGVLIRGGVFGDGGKES